MLTLFYDRCSKYYGALGGQGSYGCASEEEKKLTMTLFIRYGLFKKLFLCVKAGMRKKALPNFGNLITICESEEMTFTGNTCKVGKTF